MWIVQNKSKRPLTIRDLGFILHPKQTRDLDTVGRERANLSKDIKAFLENGDLVEIKKDPPDEHDDPQPIVAAPPPVVAEQPDPEPDPSPQPEPAAQPEPQPPGDDVESRIESLLMRFPEQTRAYRASLEGIQFELEQIGDTDELPPGDERASLEHKKRLLISNRKRILGFLGVEEADADRVIQIMKGVG